MASTAYITKVLDLYAADLISIQREEAGIADTQNSLDLQNSINRMWRIITNKDQAHLANQLTDLAGIAFELLAVMRDTSIAEVISEALSLHHRKNAGYAGHSNDPWANFRLATLFGVTPSQGVLVRLSDKYSRLQSLQASANNDQVGESYNDTLADFAAYCLIAVCLLEEEADAKESTLAYMTITPNAGRNTP
jgi:hypothetical protein